MKRTKVLTGTPAEHGYSFPAEWTAHAATWISWPRPEGISFPGSVHTVSQTREWVILSDSGNFKADPGEMLRSRRTDQRGRGRWRSWA